MKAVRLRGAPATFALQLCQHELDMLAGTEIIGGEIRARAETLSRQRAAYRYAVAPATRGIDHTEFGEHWFAAGILKLEILIAPELAAQSALPHICRHIGRGVQAGQSRLGAGGFLARSAAFFLHAVGFHERLKTCENASCQIIFACGQVYRNRTLLQIERKPIVPNPLSVSTITNPQGIVALA